MNGEGAIEIWQSFFEHELCAGKALLAGLKQKHHPAPQRFPALAQQFCRARQHGHMGIVAAGVHDAFALRAEGQASVFGHGQRVHIAAQQQRRPICRAAQGRDNSAAAFVQCNLKGQAVQRFENLRAGGGQIEPQLGLGVNAAAQRHHLGLHGVGRSQQRFEIAHRHGRSVARLAARRTAGVSETGR